MNANVVGLIELENGLSAELTSGEAPGFDRADRELAHLLQRLEYPAHDSNIDLPARPLNVRSYQTRFIRANFDQLNCDLQQEFDDLLCRLFESQE